MIKVKSTLILKLYSILTEILKKMKKKCNITCSKSLFYVSWSDFPIAFVKLSNMEGLLGGIFGLFGFKEFGEEDKIGEDNKLVSLLLDIKE